MNNRIVFLLVMLLPACDFENPYYNKLYGSWTCNGNGIGLAADTYYRDGKFTRYQNENKKMIYEEGRFTLDDNFLKLTIKRTANRVKGKYKELSTPVIYQYKINRLSSTMLDFKSASEGDKPLYMQPQQTCRKVNEQRIGFLYASAKIGHLQKKSQAMKNNESPVTLALSIFNSNGHHNMAATKLAANDVFSSNSSIKSVPDNKGVVQKPMSVTKSLFVNDNHVSATPKKLVETKNIAVKSTKNEIEVLETNKQLAAKVSGEKDQVIKSEKVPGSKASVARTAIDTNKVVIVVRNNTQQLNLTKTERKQGVDAIKIKAIRDRFILKNKGKVIITINKPVPSIKAAPEKLNSKKVINKSNGAELIVAKTKQKKVVEKLKKTPVASIKSSKSIVNTDPHNKLMLAKLEKHERNDSSENMLSQSISVDAKSDTIVEPKSAMNSAEKIAEKPKAKSKTTLVNESTASSNKIFKPKQVTKLEEKTIAANQLHSDQTGGGRPVKTVKNLIKHQNLLGQQIKFLDDFQRDRNRAYDTLRSLSLAMVPGMNLKSIQQKKSTFVISGQASSRARIKYFVKRLSRSPHVKKVRIKRINTHRKYKTFLIGFQQAHSVKSYEYLYIRPAVVQQNMLGAGRRIRELRTIRDRLLKRFPNKKEAKLLVRKLKWKAKKVGLTIISFKQKKDNILKDHIISQTRIVAVGDYDSIVVFLNRLGRRKHVNQIKNLQLHVQNDITKPSEKAKGLRVSMTLNLFRVPKLQKQRQRIPNLKYRFVKLSPYNRVPYSDDTGIINPFKYIVGRYTDYCNGPLSYEKINKVKLVAVLNRKKKMALLKASNGKIYRARFGTCIARNTKISRITKKSVIMKTVEVKFGRPTIMVRNITLQAK